MPDNPHPFDRFVRRVNSTHSASASGDCTAFEHGRNSVQSKGFAVADALKHRRELRQGPRAGWLIRVRVFR